MSVEIIDKIKPKNNGTFPLVDASDVEMPDGSRLSDHNFMDASQLPAAVDDALAKAKASGEFDGKDGKDGTDGKDGKDGKDGYTPVKGIDYFDGAPGPEGPAGSPGLPGRDGADGKTPVKGTDYYTEEDRNAFRDYVLESFVGWEGGSY